jgi:uncharacterized protein YsxB (DUF464 family)
VVPDIKPALLPSGQTSQELQDVFFLHTLPHLEVRDVFLLHSLPQLEASSTKLSNVILTRVQLEMKEIAEEVENGVP